jgi:hypothetical protein
VRWGEYQTATDELRARDIRATVCPIIAIIAAVGDRRAWRGRNADPPKRASLIYIYSTYFWTAEFKFNQIVRPSGTQFPLFLW